MSDKILEKYSEEVLAHHGILGMKWGVRRYQNKDGSLTPAGKKHYSEEVVKAVKNSHGAYGEKKEVAKAVVDKMITNEIDQKLQKARSKMLSAKPTVNYDDIDKETYSLLEKDYKKYEAIAKKNGYSDDETPIWQDVFDAAEKEVFSNHPDWKKQDDNWNKAVDDFIAEVGKISYDMLSEYSDIKIDPNDKYSLSVGNYVNGILFDRAQKLAHSEDALTHYGILGMKWGVRRYQNADGSYTKRGLERYSKSQNKYDEANENLKRAKENAKAGTGNRSEIKTAKKAQTAAKKQLEKDYKQLKLDNLADQGKELYKSGKTITSGQSKLMYAELGVIAVSKIASSALATSGKAIFTKYGAVPVSKIAPSAIALGGTAVNAALTIKNARDNKRLRAYYAH